VTARQLANRRYYLRHQAQILASHTTRRRALGTLAIGSPELAKRMSVRHMPRRPGHCPRCGIDVVPCPYCAAELAREAQQQSAA
jgi:hypothetical protein